MSKQAIPQSDMTDSFDIPEEIRETIVRELKEWELQKPERREMEAAALLSADEVEKLNAAVDTVAHKLGFRGELATIDSFLQLRNARVARILSAAYMVEGRLAPEIT